MSKKPYYTSTELIAAVKRKIAMPLTQVTFTDQDVLDFASEELFLSQVPSILQYHEEYFVTSQIVPIVSGETRYSIPSRAIGMKLRDIFFQDVSGSLYEMANIGPSNADVFMGANNGSYPKNFFIEGNEVVIPDTSGVTGSLVLKYYLRPNSLVLNERAAISNSLVKVVTIDVTTLNVGDTLVINGNTLTAGTDFTIGTNSATAASLATAISGLTGFSATSASADVDIFYKRLSATFSTNNPAAIIIDSRIGVRCDTLPTNFAEGILVDILQTEGGHNTLAFDVELGPNSVSSDTVFFDANQMPSKFVVGDYICEQNECIIPQIPNDLHTLLAERACMRILESLGDAQGVQTQTAKVTDLEARQAVIIDNRTEGAPRKIVNRNSLLRFGKSGRIRRGNL